MAVKDQPIKEYAISEKTKENYANIVKKLNDYSGRKRSESGSMSEWFITPMDLVTDLMGRTDISANTVTTYVYALIWHLRQNNHIKEFAEAESKLLDLYAEVKSKRKILRDMEQKDKRKRKSLPNADFTLLIEHLTEMSAGGAPWAGRAQRWMLAGLAAGIRPAEWVGVKWVDETKTALRVTNGKIKSDVAGFLRGTENEEANTSNIEEVVKTRDIPVENEADRMVIDVHIETVRAFVLNDELPIPLESFRKNCNHAIWCASKNLWGSKKQYNLYSARRQFSANQRAAVGATRTSELMGHSRVDSPSASYCGSANQAYSRTGGSNRSANFGWKSIGGIFSKKCPEFAKSSQLTASIGLLS